ncbi:hypothetical protein X975_08209, partial [Stegodyphus mimosarum]
MAFPISTIGWIVIGALVLSVGGNKRDAFQSRQMAVPTQPNMPGMDVPTQPNMPGMDVPTQP